MRGFIKLGSSIQCTYGLDEQVPNTTFVYNDRFLERKIGSQSFISSGLKSATGGTRDQILEWNRNQSTTLPRTLLEHQSII